jgi:cyclic pyranopterin phosphate synthase
MSPDPQFTHIGPEGQVRMVDVSPKAPSLRSATARGVVAMGAETLEKIRHNAFKKGNVLETARIAGIMAAKRTAELIPMCHPLNIEHVRVDFTPQSDGPGIGIEAEVRLTGRTGVEMEALTAVAVAALTIYDMCKSHDRAMTIGEIRLMEKKGGRSGHFRRDSEDAV